MPLDAIDLNTIDELYSFVETAIQQTALVLVPDALFRPWVRAVSAECREVRWLYLDKPLSEQLLQHLSNFAHTSLPEKGFVLFDGGRLVTVVDIDAIDGSSRPDRLASIVRHAFTAKATSSTGARPRGKFEIAACDAYQLLGASESDSDAEIKKKYKQMLLQYHPDRAAHLGPELRELAATKTTDINAAFAAIRRLRGF
jgi:hypothetical protein